MMENEIKQVQALIQKACDDAADKGVEVKLELHASGMMPGERIDVIITATPKITHPGVCIYLSPAEVQSKLDRVRFAQGLIEQLSAGHDGRNTWLFNYGIGQTYDQWRSNRGYMLDPIIRSAIQIKEKR